MSAEPIEADPVVEQARAEGFSEGRAAAAADMNRHLVGVEFRALAKGRRVPDDRLELYLEHTNVDAFLTADGAVDVEKIGQTFDLLLAPKTKPPVTPWPDEWKML